MRGFNPTPLWKASLAECTLAVFVRSIGDRDQTHPRHRGSELQGDGAACRTSSNHSDTDRMTSALAVPKDGIYNHGYLLPLDERPIAILLRDQSRNQWPLNAKRRIVEAHTPHCALSVELRGHVVHLRVV